MEPLERMMRAPSIPTRFRNFMLWYSTHDNILSLQNLLWPVSPPCHLEYYAKNKRLHAAKGNYNDPSFTVKFWLVWGGWLIGRRLWFGFALFLHLVQAIAHDGQRAQQILFQASEHFQHIGVGVMAQGVGVTAGAFQDIVRPLL